MYKIIIFSLLYTLHPAILRSFEKNLFCEELLLYDLLFRQFQPALDYKMFLKKLYCVMYIVYLVFCNTRYRTKHM